MQKGLITQHIINALVTTRSAGPENLQYFLADSDLLVLYPHPHSILFDHWTIEQFDDPIDYQISSNGEGRQNMQGIFDCETRVHNP